MAEHRDLFYHAQDDLRLYARDWGPLDAPRLPVVCLSGIARTSADFETLAKRLATDPLAPRRVIAPDYRGRGRSAYDPDPRHYDPRTELTDVTALLTVAGIDRAVFVGTSRGGILAMLIAAVRPGALAGVVLNDIGPVIDMAGLLRIKGYVGRMPKPRTWAEAVAVLKGAAGAQFPALTEEDWEGMARRTFRQTQAGAIEADYDPKLLAAVQDFDAANPPPELWPQFDGLAETPVLVLRGEHSDILSRGTVAAMRARRPDLEMVEIPGQGHAPLLTDGFSLETIAGFIARCEAHMAPA